MKSYFSKVLLYGILVLLPLYSCTDNWLEEHASNQISADEQFDAPDGFRDALMGVYIGMGSTQLYGKDLTWNLVDILSQQYASFPSNSDYANIQDFKYISNQAEKQIETIWTKSYNIIGNIDLELEMLEKREGILSNDEYNVIKGELLGLRAFLHFDLVRLFEKGNFENRPELSEELGIPYVTNFSKEITPQNTYQENFDLIEDDLKSAIALLEDSDPIVTGEDIGEGNSTLYENRNQRMNYYAVKALLARVYLWEGELEKAKDMALDVIDNSFAKLIDSETYPVSTDRIFSKEILFELDREGLGEIIDDLLDASGNSVTNNNALYYNFEYVEDLFETNNPDIGIVDVRYNTLMESQARGYINNKLFQGRSGNDALNQIPLITISEMYYIVAEYYTKDNQTDKALQYLNSIRESRGILQDIPPQSTAEEVLSEIEKEYNKEFLSEGQLFFYYKRTGKEHLTGVSKPMGDSQYVLPLPSDEIEFGNRK